MKVLHLSSEKTWRGGEQQIAYLIEELDKQGIENFVACRKKSAFEKHCIKNNIKLIYISTDYVYPGITGDYKENDSVLPFTNYGWSKLGGECAVQMYSNSLIVRLCLCNYPFEHEFAFDDMIKNYIYEKGAAKIILDLLDEMGIINIGGPTMSVYDFVKQDNPNVKPKHTEYFKEIPLNTSMNLNRLNCVE